MYSNDSSTVPARNGGIEVFSRNSWRKTGHCRRCDNGLSHTYRRRGAGGEKPSGVSLAASDPNRIKNTWEDEIAPGEKRFLRRRVRARGRVSLRRLVREET